MSQTPLAAPAAAAPDTERSHAPVVGAWARTPPPAAGVLRIRPLPYEATASYLEHLAHAYRLALPQLLDSTGITVHAHGTTPTAELALSSIAARRVAAVARVQPADLALALHRLTHHAPGSTAAAHWKPLDVPHRAVAACTLCTRQHSRGAAGSAWVHRPWHRLVCVRHHQAAPDPRLASPLHTGNVPELAAARHAHQRLTRHPRGASAWMAAHAITTRWYDQQQHLTDRWHRRLHHLALANAHLDHTGNASATLLARDLVIYPETVTLARILATLPHQSRTRSPRDVLGVIAHRLQLANLTPVTGDPLTAYLTHTRP
ncbi:hypothetical protein [Streptomyces sp. URMC 124]|uniref:hypothetical protein n=1 Tax=Streptomyces sp. URMC 124 TaxID=3423405 RepID=UPI003F1E3C8B